MAYFRNNFGYLSYLFVFCLSSVYLTYRFVLFFSDSVQSYSFVLTTDDSKWRFGFCRHDPKTDSTMVIITLLPWHDTFFRFLTILAELRRTDTNDFQRLLTETYNGGIPDIGGQLKFPYNHGINVS